MSSQSLSKGKQHKVPEKLEDSVSAKSQNNIVTSLAEKAMSVAGPVVPMKEDGGLDQERSLICFTYISIFVLIAVLLD